MIRNGELDAFIAETLAEHLIALKFHLETHVEKLIAAKPLPPFVPPPIWTAGRHGAGAVVRAHGGIFCARRDTESEPGDEDGAWLPLVVGLAGFDMRWVDDHKFVCMARLSDGRIIETEREIAVPVVCGYWESEKAYRPGDRVFRFGEWHCLKLALGVDPTKDDAGHWEKVGGKYARDLTFRLDESTGSLTENGRPVGNLDPLITQRAKEVVLASMAEALAKQVA